MMGEDPFAKIKGLISEMIEKLEADAAKEASHKAFCDKEMAETKAKKEEKESDLDTLSTKIDKATAKIAKLKEEIATLQEELAAIAKAQAEADEIRADRRRRGKRPRPTTSPAWRASAWRSRFSAITTRRRRSLSSSSRLRVRRTRRPRVPPRASSACLR